VFLVLHNATYVILNTSMALPVRDPKLIEYSRRVADRSQPISDLDLRRMLNDLKTMVERASHVDAAAIFGVIGICYMRQRSFANAVESFRLALQRLPASTAGRATILCNFSAALIELGRYREAANACIEAARIDHVDMHVTLGNLAEALDRLGEREHSLAVMQEAIRVANFNDPYVCFAVALQCAELGLDHEAVEFCARFIALAHERELGNRSAVDLITGARNAGELWLGDAQALMRSINRVVLLQEANRTLADEVIGLDSRDESALHKADAEADAVFNATRPLRDAALNERRGN